MSIKREAFVGAIDQSTTGTKFLVFDSRGELVSSAFREHEQIYPEPGWVEHDPQKIWNNLKLATQKALRKANLSASDLLAVGITNQRETVFVWDEKGTPLHNAVVWQDRRTSSRCRELAGTEVESKIEAKTGLKLDPYFSATKIEWLLENTEGLKEKARKGKAYFGTAESWLVWKLTEGRVFATDYSNVSRTMLFDIKELKWDTELLDCFQVPLESLPEPRESVHAFGRITALEELEDVPICAAFGDQQAALFGQVWYRPGEAKNTYGTGSFLLMNTEEPIFTEKLLTTVGFALDGRVSYALEGSIYSTGATIQWLRDGLGIIDKPAESEKLARKLEDNQGVYFVPAFTGLGAPHWDHQARGTIIGLTRGSDERHLARAGLESIAYQVEDVLRAMRREGVDEISELRVDGGGSENDFLCQFQSDISSVPVLKREVSEATALGAALGAGLSTGLWEGIPELQDLLKSKKETKFTPRLERARRNKLYEKWEEATARAKEWSES